MKSSKYIQALFKLIGLDEYSSRATRKKENRDEKNTILDSYLLREYELQVEYQFLVKNSLESSNL